MSWTQVRPGTTHPNVADFHRAFEKPWQQCFLARGMCDVRFGTSTVRTLLKRPLEHLLPQGTASLPAHPGQRLQPGVDGTVVDGSRATRQVAAGGALAHVRK